MVTEHDNSLTKHHHPQPMLRHKLCKNITRFSCCAVKSAPLCHAIEICTESIPMSFTHTKKGILLFKQAATLGVSFRCSGVCTHSLHAKSESPFCQERLRETSQVCSTKCWVSKSFSCEPPTAAETGRTLVGCWKFHKQLKIQGPHQKHSL